MAAKFEVSQSGGGFRWVLKSQGRTLATGESYSRRALAEKAIESLRKAAAGATVVDLTVKPAKAAPAKAAGKATRTARKTAARAAKTTKKAAATKRTAKAATSKRTATAAKKSSAPRQRTSKGG